MGPALDAMGVPPEHRNDASALVDPDGAGPRLFFQKVPEAKTAKNRVHLDLRAAPGCAGTIGWTRSRRSATAWSRSAHAGCSG